MASEGVGERGERGCQGLAKVGRHPAGQGLGGANRDLLALLFESFDLGNTGFVIEPEGTVSGPVEPVVRNMVSMISHSLGLISLPPLAGLQPSSLRR